MHDRERHMAEEGLAGQPDHDIACFPQRPQHRQLVDAVEGLAQDVNALRFELVEMVHCVSACFLSLSSDARPRRNRGNTGEIRSSIASASEKQTLPAALLLLRQANILPVVAISGGIYFGLAGLPHSKTAMRHPGPVQELCRVPAA